MDLTPIERGLTGSTQIRKPESIKVNQDGSVEVESTPDRVEIKKRPRKKEGFLAGTTKTVLAGIGMGSGIVGGAAIGSALGAGEGVLSGIIGGNLALAGVGTASVVGGILGAVIFSAAGAYGGWTFASALIKGGRFLKDLILTETFNADEAHVLNLLKGAEDNKKDAKKAFKYIKSNLKKDENIIDEGENYNEILRNFTNKQTDKALSAYSTVKELLPPGKERAEAVSELEKFKALFKNPDESMDSLYTILKNLKGNESISRESENFRSVAESLGKCAGEHVVISPDVAEKAYNVIKESVAPGERKDVIARTLGQLSEIKLSPDEVCANVGTLLDFQEKGEDLALDAKSLVELVKATGDNSDARKVFTAVKKYLPPGEARGKVTPELAKLSETFGGVKKGESALLAVLANLNANDIFEEESESLRGVATALRQCGGEDVKVSPESAAEAYSFIKEHFAPGERKEAVNATFGQFANMNLKPEEAIANLKTLVESLQQGESLATETQNYLGFYKALGGNGELARQAYMTVKEYLPPDKGREHVLAELAKFSEAFDGTENAFKSLATVLKNLKKSESFEDECQRLRDTRDALKSCSSEDSNISPEVAKDAYLIFKEHFQPSERSSALSTTFGQYGEVKTGPKEAIENLKTTLKWRQEGDDLKVETGSLLDLLKRTEGNMGTARDFYATLKKNLSPGKERSQALLEFDSFKSIFGGSTDEALYALKEIIADSKAGDAISGEAEILRLTADLMKKDAVSGSEVTAQAVCEAYRTIKTSFTPDKRKEATEATLGLFGNFKKLNSTDMNENLKLLISSFQKGDDLAGETELLMSLPAHTGDDMNKARGVYGNAKKSLATLGDRKRVPEELSKFKGTFKSADESIGALNIVLSSLNKEDSFEKESAMLRKEADLLKKNSGGAATPSSELTGEAYRAVKAGFAPTEREGALKSTLEQFGEFRQLQPRDSVENLKLLLSSRKKEDELSGETRYLMTLPEKTGGNMELARHVYAGVKQLLPPGPEKESVPEQLSLFAKTFGSPEAAVRAFDLVLKGLNKSEDFIKESGSLRNCADLIKRCSGDSVTPEAAASIYGAFDRSFGVSERPAALQSLIGEFGQFPKQGIGDVEADVNLILGSLKKEDGLKDEAQYLMKLREKTGGNMDSARKVYGSAKQHLAPGAERNSLFDELSRFAQTFNGAQDAVKAFDLVIKNMQRPEAFGREAENLRNCAESLKRCTTESVNPEDASAMYGLFDSSFRQDERSGAMTATLGQFGGYKKMGINEVSENLKLLIGTRQSGEDLSRETKTLMGLLDRTGGSMTDAREVYSAAKKYLSPGNDRDALPETLSGLTKTFGTSKDGVRALVEILKELKSGESFTREAEYLKLCAAYLSKCSSSSHAMADEAYGLLKASFHPDERRRALDSTLSKIAGHGRISADEAVKTFKFLIESRKQGEDLSRETDTLLNLVEKSKGNLDLGRKIYNQMKTKFSPHERSEALQCFDDLNSLSGSPGDALDTLLKLHEGLYNDDKFSDCVRHYSTLHRGCSYSGSTDEHALNLYKYISKNYRYGREDAIRAMERLLSAERGIGGPDNARKDFEFVRTHLESGENAPQEIDKFINYLNQEKNSERAQQKYLDSKFRELHH